MIAAALLLSLPVLAAEQRPATRVFAVGDKLAAVYEHTVELYDLTAQSIVTVSGRSAFGPLAESGLLLLAPETKPSKILRFAEPIAKPPLPERNAPRFMLCTDPALGPVVAEGKGFARFCGVMDINGNVVYQAAPPKDGAVEALALSDYGHEALFEYRKGKDVESYLVWSEKGKTTRTYKADMRDMELRRTLNRFGLNDWNPEPDNERKPESHK